MKYTIEIFMKYLIKFFLYNKKNKIFFVYLFIHQYQIEFDVIDYKINQIVDHLNRINRILLLKIHFEFYYK